MDFHHATRHLSGLRNMLSQGEAASQMAPRPTPWAGRGRQGDQDIPIGSGIA
ncbi:MAG: hypothetical protein OXC82_09850 [Rhodobacteraceae bacterium]|nr:hypothetical protein [Paracoccaceae bacterium]